MELPVGGPPGDASGAPAEAAELSPRPSVILIVDDEPSITKALTHLLQRDGHTVNTAANGRLALMQLQERAYDLILWICACRNWTGLASIGRWRAAIRPPPAVHLPDRGYPEPGDPHLGAPTRRAPPGETLHGHSAPAHHPAGPASRMRRFLPRVFVSGSWTLWQKVSRREGLCRFNGRFSCT